MGAIFAFLIIGIYIFWGAMTKPSFFWDNRRAMRLRGAFGDKATRTIYIVIAVAMILISIVLGLFRLWENQADAHFADGQYEAGIAKYEELYSFDKKNINYLNGLAFGNYMLGNTSEAAEYVGLSLSQNKEPNYDGYILLAWLHEDQGELEEAAAALATLLTHDPDYVFGIQEAADIYEQQGDWENAIASYQKIIELQPQNGDTYLYLTNIYYYLEMYADELAVYKQMNENQAVLAGLTLPETQAVIDYNIAVTYYETEQYDLAAKHFQGALAIDQEDVDAWYYLASCQALSGDAENALNSLRRTFDLDSSYAELVSTDADFVSLIENEEFVKLVELYKE